MVTRETMKEVLFNGTVRKFSKQTNVRQSTAMVSFCRTGLQYAAIVFFRLNSLNCQRATGSLRAPRSQGVCKGAFST